jgi:hypothetical protein
MIPKTILQSIKSPDEKNGFARKISLPADDTIADISCPDGIRLSSLLPER